MITRILLLLLLFMSVFRYYGSLDAAFSYDSLVLTILSLVAALIVFSFRTESNKKLKKNAYTICLIFLISYVIVYFFEYIGYIIGEYDTILSSMVLGSNANVNSSSILSLACIQTFLLGYSIVKEPFKGEIDYNTHITKQVDILVLVFALAYFIVTPKGYFEGGYGTYMNEIGVSVASTLTLTFTQAAQLASIVLITINNKNNEVSIRQYLNLFSKPFYIGFGFFTLLVIVSGDRGPVLYSFITFASGYFIINQKRLSFVKASIGICIMAFSIAFMGVFRNFDADFSLDKFSKVQEYRSERYDGENPIFTNTRDLSICVETYRAQYQMAEYGVCFYGVGIINRFLGIIPGLRYFLYPVLGIDADQVDTALLTTQYLGIDCGAGTSCVGDTFINLGFLGSLIFTFIFGLLVKKMDTTLWSEGKVKSSLFLYILAFYTLSIAVYMPRSHFFASMNCSAYAFLFIYVLNKMSKKQSK